MPRWLRNTLVLLVLAGGIVALRLTVWAPEPVAVRTVAAERGLVEESVTNSKAGTVQARRRAKLSPGTSGVVAELLVERGQRVARDEVLMRLDDASQSALLDQSERALEVAEARSERACIAADRARRELERNRELRVSGIVSDDQIDALENTLALAVADCTVAAAEVEHARAALAVARSELDKTVLHSPFDAVVAEVPVELGEWATPSVPLLVAPSVVEVIDPASLYVAAPMDEVDSALLAPGQAARVTIDAYPGKSFPAHVVRVAPYVLDVESQNRTVEIEVELDDQAFSASLLPGTSADVEVILSTRPDVLRVPSGALLEGGRVLVVRDGRLEELLVETGIKNWDWTEIVAGLAEGERVVTSLDRAEVRAGAQVAEGSGAEL